ncbi:MAG TPA: GWxTD domain-containing protein [Candidatus Polarisedimenticolia bacterium]|nr:GWxTD domain-containing protein [Candidatus Polarisedimenticolia bacterium]
MASEQRPPDLLPPDPGAPRPVVVSPTALAAARWLRLRPRHGPRPSGQQVRDPLEVARWSLSLGILLLLLLFLALLVVFFLPGPARAAVSTGINFDKPTKDWDQGPVRYIITKQEVKAYKALETELDRANFIDWFWQRRDIQPETPENEFRERYEQRVLESTRKFSATTTPGWKTDMGKVYILVGPPDEVNSDLVAKTHRGIVTWVYRRPPFPDLSPNTVIGFARDASGEFVISTSPTMDSDVARGLKFQKQPRLSEAERIIPGRDPAYLAAGAPITQSDLATMLVVGRLQQLPPAEEEMFRSFVSSREFYGSITAESRCDFYKAADDTTYTTITIGIKSSAVQYRSQGDKEIPDVQVFGKMIDKDDPKVVYPLAGDAGFAEDQQNIGAGPEDLLIFQATGAFKPGRYQLALGVQDRVSKKVGTLRRDVTVPDMTPKTLALSSITLAGSMEPTDYNSSPGKPFHMGKFRLVPRPDEQFGKSDELNVYFQVYNPAPDPATGKPRLGVLYRFRAKEADESYKDFGAYEVKEATGQVQGYAVPLERWAPGEYQVQVTVRDKVAEASVSAEAVFTIRP